MSGKQALSLNKFRGTLVGALIGDCLGAPFEFDVVSKVVLQKYFDKMEDPNFKAPVKKYTDDTVMTKVIAESLIQHGALNEEDIAKRFVEQFFSDKQGRGYGGHVRDVFHKLRNTRFSDIWKPAQEQFNGAGSYGNGGAMRISPIALFFSSDYLKMLEAAKNCTKITHTHRLGVNGALLQATAIYESLCLPSDEDLDELKFIENLITKISSIEATDNDVFDPDDKCTYEGQLKEILYLLEKGDPCDEDVLKILGNGEEALYSVPTAIYCFLRAQKPIRNIETENKFRRVVQYSISLGGDTDTIGSMAGALAGAYLGHQNISRELQVHCEGLDHTLSLADLLHSKASSTV